jgi:hypothetical protein
MGGDIHQSFGSTLITQWSKGELVLCPLFGRLQGCAHKPTGEEPIRRAAATPAQPLNSDFEN